MQAVTHGSFQREKETGSARQGDGKIGHLKVLQYDAHVDSAFHYSYRTFSDRNRNGKQTHIQGSIYYCAILRTLSPIHMGTAPLLAHVSCTIVYTLPVRPELLSLKPLLPSPLATLELRPPHDQQFAREHADCARVAALHLGLGMTTCISSNAKLEECP